MESKKSAGIITLSASDNCGSLLQAYALKRIIQERYNLQTEIINFESEKSKQVYEMFPRGFWKRPKRTIFMIRNYYKIKNQKIDYELFRKDYLNLFGTKFATWDEISKEIYQYDFLIAGSDQVWNINMSDYDDAFMLPGASNAKKIAYAPSLGATMSLSGEKEDKIKEWLLDFDCLSVREETGKKTLDDFLNEDVQVVADPTLLLDGEVWDYVAGDRFVEGDYIFFYSWSYPDETMNRLVGRFSEEKDMPVYVINPSKWYKHRPEDYGFQLYKNSGPIAFLNLMKYAKYVFVQSFHGLVFANVFKKRFAFLCEGENVDFRINNLISYLNENTQIVRKYGELDRAFNSELAYTSKEFEAFKEKSLAYLDNALKE